MRICTSFYNADIPKEFIKVSISTVVYPQFEKVVDYHEKGLAPSYSIFKEYRDVQDEKLYANRFKDEVLNNFDFIEFFKRFDKDSTLCLMCYETPYEFCHRHIVSEHISMLFGIKVHEIGFDDKPNGFYKYIKEDKFNLF